MFTTRFPRHSRVRHYDCVEQPRTNQCNSCTRLFGLRTLLQKWVLPQDGTHWHEHFGQWIGLCSGDSNESSLGTSGTPRHADPEVPECYLTSVYVNTHISFEFWLFPSHWIMWTALMASLWFLEKCTRNRTSLVRGHFHPDSIVGRSTFGNGHGQK